MTKEPNRNRQGKAAPRTAREGGAGERPTTSAAEMRRRAIAYLRVSTRGQAEQGMGLEAQRRRVAEFARGERYALLEIVEESASAAVRDGEFSSVEHRPVLSSLLTRAEEQEYDTLIVSSLDRLSRDQIDSQLLKRWFSKFGVRVVSATGETNGAENGIFGELIDRILGAIHDFDRQRILERVRAGKAIGKAHGRHVHGRIPYGFRTRQANGGKQLEPFAEQADVVRRIFADVIAGDSPGRIARTLTAEGIPSPEGTSWRVKAVTRVVTNKAMTGERYGVKRAHEPIVSRRTFNAANAALRARADAWARNRVGDDT